MPVFGSCKYVSLVLVIKNTFYNSIASLKKLLTTIQTTSHGNQGCNHFFSIRGVEQCR